MAKHPWLAQRNGVFYVRAPVPKDIGDTFGKREVTYSLKTTDRTEALRLVLIEAQAVSDLFERHRRDHATAKLASPVVNGGRTAPRLSGPQIQRWCDEHFQRVVDDDFATRCQLSDAVKGDPDGFAEDKYIEHPRTEWYLTFYENLSIKERLICCIDNLHKRRLRELQDALAAGDCTAHGRVADQFLSSNIAAVAPAERLRLVRKLMETELAALESIIKKDSHRYDEIARQCVSNSPVQSPATGYPDGVAPGPLVTLLIPHFLEQGKRSGLAKKTTMSDATDLREFLLVVGDKSIRNYDAADGIKYKDALLAVPSQRKVPPFKGLNFSQAAARADEIDPARNTIRRLHVDTVNDKLMVVRKFFRWANDREKNVFNPVEGSRIRPRHKRGWKSRKRYPFDASELQKIFSGPIYTGCESIRRWKQPGSVVPRESAQFWVPLIGLFSGMRLGEIIQLRVADVKKRDSIAYFNVTAALEEDDDDGAKSTKNVNSVREVPLHATLFSIGFGDFLKSRQNSGAVRLFEEFDRSPTDDSWSKTFSAWFTRYRRHVGVERIVEGRNRIDFHSFRHVFEDAVRDLPDVKKECRDALQGHGETGSSNDYGLGVSLQRLNEAVQKIWFTELDLSRLISKPMDEP